MKQSSKTFCVLPWTHAATYNDGSVILCCVSSNDANLNLNKMTLKEAWNSDYFKQTRLKMLNGECVSACRSCYKEEESGITSHRIAENIKWNNEFGEDYIKQLVDNTHEDGTIDNDLITLDLRLGNACNLQCVMCRPTDSSKWVKDAKFLSENLKTQAKWDWRYKIENYSTEKFEWYKDKDFWNSFFDNASNIRHIIFGGGEPLYLKEHYELIEQLVNRGYSHQIQLRYHTNGTIYNQDLVNLWEKFKFVEVMISIDGYKEVNNYIRYPSQWEDIEKNLRLYDCTTSNIDPQLLCTVQVLNIEHLPDFSQWLIDQQFNKIGKQFHCGVFHPGILHWPQYLCVKTLPLEVKKRVTNKLMSFIECNNSNNKIQKFKQLIEFMNSEDWSDKFDQTIDYLTTIDGIRDTDYRQIVKFG